MAGNMALGARGEDVAVEFLIDAGLEISNAIGVVGTASWMLLRRPVIELCSWR